MEKFNHQTATVSDLHSVMDFATGALEALIANSGSATKHQEKEDLNNFSQFEKLAHICQNELVERLSNYLALK